MADKETPKKPRPLSEEEVLEFLSTNPDFLIRHPELLELLTPPAQELGGDVVDFQHYALKNLQKGTAELKNRYNSLVDFCRDNLSVQGQVHDAVVRLVRARSLEQLLEVLTLDLVSLFDVDVVRLAVESEAAEFYDTYYSEHNYSGIVFVPQATAEILLQGKKALLVEDTEKYSLPGFEQIFADCSGLIRSCAILRLEMELIDREVLLTFGVRYKDRFHGGQGLELLSFLGQIVAHQLDTYLSDLSV